MVLARFLALSVLAALVAVLPLRPALAADANLPAGVKPVWDMAKAFHESTPTSERICINGLWRFQPATGDLAAVPSDNWGYFKVPGSWPGINDWITRDSQTAYPHASWRNTSLNGLAAAWYQREITVPDSWKSRRVFITADTVNSYAAVYLDGALAGQIYFPLGQCDITSFVKPGTKQLLSICVKAVPLSDIMLAFNDTSNPKAVPGKVERKGLCGDVFLLSTPKGPRVDNLKVDTSVRKWTVTFSASLADLAPDKQYRLKAVVSEAGKPLRTFTSESFAASALKDGVYSFTQDWHADKLWDVHTPQNMYTVQISLLDASSKDLDVALPVRFGFREFWIQGRDFYLNGSRFYVYIVPFDNGQLGAHFASYDVSKETFLRDKSYGFSAVYTHNYGCAPGSHVGYQDILRAADDAGMLVAFSMPHFRSYDWKSANGPKTYEQTAAAYVRMAQNHPSVVFYSMSHNALGYIGEDNPDTLDGAHEINGAPGQRTDGNAKTALRAQAIVEKLDPARVVYHHSSGNTGNMWTKNLYLNFTPIQEVSDWFEHWSKEGIKPVLLCEYLTPYPLDWFNYRGHWQGKRDWGSAALPWEYLVAEYNSQFLGDPAFNVGPADLANLKWEAKAFRSQAAWNRWSYPMGDGTSCSRGFDDKEKVWAMYNTDNLRAFRTYGVSAIDSFGYFAWWKKRAGADESRREFKVDWDNLQRPGFSGDFVQPKYDRPDVDLERADWLPTAAGAALIRNSMPLLAYIGGSPDHLSAKEHNLLPGDSVQKNLVIINNSRLPQTCSYTWSMPGLSGANQSVSVKTGDKAVVPIAFTLPADAKTGPLTLTATVNFSAGAPQTDTFIFNVLAPVAPVKAKPKAAIFDPKGQTTRLLSSLGFSATPVAADANLAGYDVLIIGKEALTPDGPGPNVSRVRDGLKVIMFEQTAPVLEKRFGFRAVEYGLRDAFVRVPDHPLLAGIVSDNLHDWRGESTLISNRLVNVVTNPNGEIIVKWCGIEVYRQFRCGNWGDVASVLVEKPAKGDFLPIIDGGFSLQYAPLMLYREGKGCMILCQLDVSGRTKDDPAARRLVANILDYAAAFTPTPRRSVLYAGDDSGKSFLTGTGLAVVPYAGGKPNPDQVLVLGPNSAQSLVPNAAPLRDFLKAGGNLFFLGASAADANAVLPAPVTANRAEHIFTVFAPPSAKSLLAGVGPADVFDRDPRPTELLTAGVTALGDGVLAFSPDSSVAFSQLAPWSFDTAKFNQKRTFRRTAFAAARILANMGASAPVPLLDRVSSPASGREPWLDSFYLDKPAEFDDPYRYFGW